MIPFLKITPEAAKRMLKAYDMDLARKQIHAVKNGLRMPKPPRFKGVITTCFDGLDMVKENKSGEPPKTG